MENRSILNLDILICAGLIIAIGALASVNLKVTSWDFWNDELYTLRYFVLVPIKQTLTDYHVPNNHIFSNLLNNLYLRLISANDLRELMDAPEYIRVPQFTFSLVSLGFVYKIGSKFFNREAAIMGVIFLATTIPFFNFSSQVRGYPLSMMLVTILTFQTLRYLHKPQYSTVASIAVLSSLLFYTIPSNLYYLLGLLGYFIALSLTKYFRLPLATTKWFYDLSAKQIWSVSLAIIAGLSIGLIAYSPIFNDVFNNPYTQSTGYFQFNKLAYYFPTVTTDFVSQRWLLVAISILGFYLGLRRYRPTLVNIPLLACLAITPFVLIFIRGDSAPYRLFSVYLPLYAIILAVGVSYVGQYFHFRPKVLLASILILSAYSCWTFYNQRSEILDTLYQDIKTGGRSQDLYTQYYAGHYQPRSDVLNLKKQVTELGLPVAIVGCEPHGINNYLEQYDIPYSNLSSLDLVMESTDSAILITNHPYSVNRQPSYTVEILNDQLTYHNMLLYTKTQMEKQKLYDTVYINDFDSTLRGGFEGMDSTKEYSTNYRAVVDSATDGASIKILMTVRTESDCNARLIIDLRRGEDIVYWEGERLKGFYSPTEKWSKLLKHVLLNDAKEGDVLKIFIWNEHGETFEFDNFMVLTSGLGLTTL